MKNNSYKPKRFLVPILSLVLISIISIASINAYLTINMFKTHMNSHIKNAKTEYFERNKDEIYKYVHRVNSAIKFQTTTVENKLKKSLKERVEIALKVAQFIYTKEKDKLNKEELIQRIAQHLNIIKFNGNRGYYFIYDSKTKIILSHPIKEFIGRDITSFKDLKGQNLIKLDKYEKFKFQKMYIAKSSEQKKNSPKINCITKFEPLDIVIGTGEYLDLVEDQTKQYVIDRFKSLEINKSRYLVLMDLHNINGGDEFATVLLNSNKPDLVGKKLNDNKKDVKGNEFRKEYLKNLREKGEGYIKYWYKKPNTKEQKQKMSYVYLQKDWNWLISTGFYFDELEQQISTMKKSLSIYTHETINKTFIIVGLLSFISILIAIFVSIRIDRTIQDYTDDIIEYEANKREQDKLIVQQSKMASMGEMLESIAHQWRQPLSVITTASGGIKVQQEYGILDDKKLFDSCDNITKSAEHLSDTINDFRNFFKEDKIKKDFNIKDIFHKTLSLLISKFKNKEISIIETIDDININGFGNELVQVFMNILNNARDELEIEEIKRLIFIDIHKINDEVIVKIKDNAGGIPKDILPKIFDAHFTTKEERNGTGIGLYMTKKIIEDSFKGTIKANNIEFEYEGDKYTGAEFKITLPLS